VSCVCVYALSAMRSFHLWSVVSKWKCAILCIISATEVTTLWRYKNLFIIIIIVADLPIWWIWCHYRRTAKCTYRWNDSYKSEWALFVVQSAGEISIAVRPHFLFGLVRDGWAQMGTSGVFRRGWWRGRVKTPPMTWPTINFFSMWFSLCTFYCYKQRKRSALSASCHLVK